MDDLLGGLVIAVVLGFAAYGLTASIFNSPDSSIVAACKERGYWQTGQTRIICSVEERK